MRIENVTEDELKKIPAADLYRLRLRMRQVLEKHVRIDEQDAFLTVNWNELNEKATLLDSELERRHLLKDSPLQGIYLVPPHGRWIWEGKKDLIVKARNFSRMVGRPLVLVSASMAYGVIKLKGPTEIGLDKFFDLAMGHLITETERQKWWPGKKKLYAYHFDMVTKYENPRPVKVSRGTQTFIQDVKFEKALIWGLTKPAYRIFEAEDLKNTPGFKGTDKVVVESKFDGVRTKISKRGGKVIIFTDPEETETPNKSKRLPHQIKELESMKQDNFALDCEIIMMNQAGTEVIHRTAVNALINGKFDPIEQSKRAHLYIFDVLELDGKSTKTWPLKERKEALNRFKDSKHIHFVRSQTGLKSGLSFVTSLPISQNALDIVAGAKPKFISEGAMIKLLAAPYSGKSWTKYKVRFEIDALVVGKHPIMREGKKTNVYNYSLAVGPLSKEWAAAITRTNPKAIIEYEGKKYNLIGRSDNSKQNVSVGSILRVAAEDVNRFETDDPNRPYFRAYVSVVLQPVQERKSPDLMLVVQRLATLTPRRERIKKDVSADAKTSIEGGKIPGEIYKEYAREGEPLPQEFYTDFKEGEAWAQTHIRGLELEDVEAYEAKRIPLAKLLENHSIHIDIRMNLGKEKLIQWVIVESDIPSYLRYLKGEARETASGVMNVQHSMSVVKPSAEEPQKLEKADGDKEFILTPEMAKQLADIQIVNRSYIIPPGTVGATPLTASWMGLIWSGRVKAGSQRKDWHEYFLFPGAKLPEANQKFFNGRFIWKCLRREKGDARWETWEASTNSFPSDPIEHREGGYYFPVKAIEVKKFGRENYEYGKKEPK